MALPKLATPTYELEVPSTGDKITYRPFLVKEEKLLLLAIETNNDGEIMKAVKNIISNCVSSKLNIDDLALFDIEYIFLNVRGKSIGENISVKLLCEDDGKTYADVDINIDDIKVVFTEGHTNHIELNDEVSIFMEYPQIDIMSSMAGDEPDANFVFRIIKNAVAQIVEGETIHERADFTEKELDEFLESLNSQQFQSIQGFFETMPKLKHEVKFKNPKTKKNNKVTLEGLNSFFA